MRTISFKVRFLQYTLNLLLLSLLTSCLASSEQKMLQYTKDTFGILIPVETTDFQILEIPIGTEKTRPYSPYQTYIKAKMEQDTYLDFLNELSMSMYDSKDISVYTLILQTQLYPDSKTPIWWNPNPKPYELSGGGQLVEIQGGNWIISTYDNEYAYFKIYEEGVLD